MAKKPLFKIIPGSEVKGDSIGHLVCQTEPPHPHAMKLPDRKKSYVLVHKVVLENHLSHLIDLKKFEIHHKNGNPTDNRVSNLELTTHSDHAKTHSHKKKFWKKSPMNKPGRKASALRVVMAFLNSNEPPKIDHT